MSAADEDAGDRTLRTEQPPDAAPKPRPPVGDLRPTVPSAELAAAIARGDLDPQFAATATMPAAERAPGAPTDPYEAVTSPFGAGAVPSSTRGRWEVRPAGELDGNVAYRPSDALGATAVMPAAGAHCRVCHKQNHAGAPRCVFCGALFPSDASITRFSPEDGPAHSQHFDVDEALPAPIADPLLGVIVADRYRILELLGRGGMGIVYKVEHTRIGKLLAMKLLAGELSRHPEVVRRFKQEALTVSKLSSPNTVQVFDFGASDGLTYLVMELVAGEDLGRVLRAQGPMPFGRLGKIIIQVCNALAEAHGKGIVHRDIKPENVMLLRGREGTDVAKVLDFGLAKLREGSELNDVTSQGAIVGTPYFMAPEQIRGEAVDARADVYALGALMYRGLTGHYPFAGVTPMAVFTKHLTEQPVSPSERAPEMAISPRVSQLVMKALAKDPARRFQRVEELQAALVSEVRSLGLTSVEDLLDSTNLRQLARPAEGSTSSSVMAGVEIATRDEVEAYERKLRRTRYGAYGALFAAVLAATGVGVKLLVSAETPFTGLEIEPNNAAGEATLVPFGEPVAGHLGKRVDATHGDRDFYAIDVPAPAGGGPAYVKLHVTALPNFAMCTMLYRPGLSSAIGQYCVGRNGRDLVMDTWRLDAGRYFFAVVQDMESYGGATPYVYENVSDAYTLLAEATTPGPGHEVEPNDQVASANAIVPSAGPSSITGVCGWAHDEDVLCVPAGTPGKIRWKVRYERHDAGVLEATPMRGGDEGAPVRIHVWGSGKVGATDVKSPWVSDPMGAEASVPRCLRLRLTGDPWSPESAVMVPSGGSEPYVVEVEPVP